MATFKAEKYEATRITIQSPNSFNQVLKNLYSSIRDPSRVDEWKKKAKSITSYSDESRKQFEDNVNSAIGPHGFMIFQEFDHGSWIPLFNVGSGLKSKRIILGNPLVAITMLKHDITAGLAVPVEILVRELEKGGRTEVLYNLPSGLIAGLNDNEELRAAVEVLDRKLERLVREVCE
ncbi:TT1751-like protein [Mollisia scopiformis]|uniref:TT1751-like protein n=1 Tax=Mollisia scopiformis TaxID=149040 RepID=A0A194X8V2_MOLSC|nr:TT1751-like protein [Mollisia scopiformis]KUJ16600.1 TT1751-like protein [Mollisia scopiformis]